MRLARAYDEVAAGDEEAAEFRRIANAVLKYWICKRAPSHAVECLECFGGNGYVEESGMPRLYREAPLASIWEGSGNVQCLDVLRAMVKSPESVEAFFAEVEAGAGAEPRLDSYVDEIRAEVPGDIETIESRARRIVERMAIALQASLLVRYGDEAVADAFCASRLSGDWGQAFGTLPAGTDFAASSSATGHRPEGPFVSWWRRRRAPAHLLGGDDAGEAAVGVDGHQGTEAAQGSVAEQRVERGVVADLEGAVVELDQVGDERGGARDLGHLVGRSRTTRPRKRWAASTTGNQGQR